MTPQKFLFIHQNFPGQFVHAAAELARLGHEVVALGIQGRAVPGVRLIRYAPKALARPSELEAARDFETKILRGTACAQAMQSLKQNGFTPDTVIAHPGWGEALFCKDVWPSARLLIFAEFFYSAEGADCNFDPEFASDSWHERARLRLKNSVHLHALHAADAGYTPTQWQLRQVPQVYHPKMSVIFDGIDTALAAPDPQAKVKLQRDAIELTENDEVITFVNRNLEPYRGYHIFMRALPAILRARPKARVLIVGADGVSYGALPPQAAGTGPGKPPTGWRDVFLNEVKAELDMDRVHFLGNVPYADFLQMLQLSTVHAYLTYPFVLSWSLLEAMSSGCAIVASDTAPVREAIEHNQTGRLVDFFDVAGIANNVIALCEDRAERARLGQAARAFALSQYDLHSHCLPGQMAWVKSLLG